MIITLTTDFGLSDPFVGIMKGVILGIVPAVRLVDISHDIHSYDIAEAAFLIDSAYRYFPPGTVHVVVVDPGVGSTRRPIAALSNGHMFVAPDNGVLSGVWGKMGSDPSRETGSIDLAGTSLRERGQTPFSVYHITNDRLFLHPVSTTFHGRDIFAPVAAHLAGGMPIDSVGPRILDFAQKSLPRPKAQGEKLIGSVLRIDKFGNIITNLRRSDLSPGFTIRIAGLPVTRLCANFSEADPGEFFAVLGSTGYIEIALNQGSAADRLKVRNSAEIEVESGTPNH